MYFNFLEMSENFNALVIYTAVAYFNNGIFENLES